MSKRELIEELPFEVDARVAIQLGRESISSSLVAISELVKNSYDADAESVKIYFKDLNSSEPSMRIEDDGQGMTYETLTNYWLRIGTDNKRKNAKSTQKKRILTGAKGLGRLGIDRLCSRVSLQTKTKDMSYALELRINWNDYVKEEIAALSSVKHGIYRVPSSECGFADNEFGTKLVLQGLKDDWSKQKVTNLRNELMLLVSPFSDELMDFELIIKSGLGDDVDGVVSSARYLKAAEWFVDAKIDKNDHVSISMHSQHHEKEYYLRPTSWEDWIKGRGKKPFCGPLSFRLYFYLDRKKDDYRKIDFEKKDVVSFLKNNRGVRIYRDNFRVKPYGNPDGTGDWLTLANRRAMNPAASSRKSWRVANHQVLGAVFISRDQNEGLLDQTNREGLVEEPPYFDLRAFALTVVEWFEGKRVAFEQEKSSTSAIGVAKRQANDSAERTKQSIARIKHIARDLVVGQPSEKENQNQVQTLLAEVHRVEQGLNDNEKFIDELEREFEAEKNTLANLASLGILTVCFGHEAKGRCNQAFISAEDLEEALLENTFMVMPDKADFIKERLRIIKDSTSYIKSFSGFALDNVRRSKRNRKKISLRSVWNDVYEAMCPSFQKQGIDVKASISESLPTFMAYRIDWESIFINFITNSIWAMRDYVDPGKRKIKVSISYEKNHIFVDFEDNGKGFEAGSEDRIFDATFSTRRGSTGDVEGTGMGLAIVKTFVEDHMQGSISASSSEELGGALFVIKIPVR